MMASALASTASLASRASFSAPLPVASPRHTSRSSTPLVAVQARASLSERKQESQSASATAVAAAGSGIVATCLGAIMSLGLPLALDVPAAVAANVRLPPLSSDPTRCERAFVGNTIGQANGVADKLLDLRQCNYSNNKEDLKGKTLSSALMSEAVFDNADMTEVVMSKAYASGASFKGVDFTSGVLDRVVFDGADLTGAKFYNTVLSGSTFDGSELKDADFEDALIGYVDIQKICRNSTLSELAKLQLGCR